MGTPALPAISVGVNRGIRKRQFIAFHLIVSDQDGQHQEKDGKAGK